MGRNRARRPGRGGCGERLLALTRDASTVPAPSPALASLLGRLYGLMHTGQMDDAEALRLRLEQRAAADPRLWVGLAQVYKRLGRATDVTASSRRAVELAPDHVGLRLACARALVDEGRLAAALLQLDAAAALQPSLSADALYLAGLYAEALKPERGRAPLLAACRRTPDDGRLLAALAIAERAEGDLTAAREHAISAIEAGELSGEALWLAADLASDQPPASLSSALQAAVSAADPERRALALYARGKLAEARGEHAAAFADVAAGADAIRRRSTYDVRLDVGHFDAIGRTFTREAIGAASCGVADLQPVFVVGLPRTGTTLVERILSAHPDVGAVGEPPAFDRALQDHQPAETLSITAWRVSALGAGRERERERERVARDYMTEIVALGGDAPRIVDKRPANILNVGLILACLPGASVIIVEREPLDTAWALLKTPFASGAHPFSYDLDDLGRYLAAHERLVERWRALRDARIHFVRYEDVVADLEAQARRLVSHCGLEWDPRCLDFKANAASATTASATSVRRAIYTTSIGGGARYARELEPFTLRFDAERARYLGRVDAER